MTMKMTMPNIKAEEEGILMFWDMLLSGIQTGYMDDLYLLIMFAAIAAMIHFTFQSKYNLIKSLIIWGGIGVSLWISFRLLYAIQYTIFYSYKDFFQQHQLAYDIFYNFGIWIFFIQVILLILGAKLIYKNSMKIKGFAILLLYMYVSLIADYCMPLFLVICDPTVSENGYYIKFETGGGVLYFIIGAIISGLLYLLYRKYLYRAMRILLSLSEEHRGSYYGFPYFHTLLTVSFIY